MPLLLPYSFSLTVICPIADERVANREPLSRPTVNSDKTYRPPGVRPRSVTVGLVAELVMASLAKLRLASERLLESLVATEPNPVVDNLPATEGLLPAMPVNVTPLTAKLPAAPKL